MIPGRPPKDRRCAGQGRAADLWPAMNHLSLNISNLRLGVRLYDMRPSLGRELAGAFAGFVRRNGKRPHETLDVLKSETDLKGRPSSDLENFVRESLRATLNRFPCPDDPERQIAHSLEHLKGFYGDSRFRRFLDQTKDPGKISIYSLERGCLLRARKSVGFLLLLKGGYFRRPKAETVCEAIHVAGSMALPLVDGIMLHGVGIQKEGIGHLFLGLSGCGKTTVSRLSPREGVISDDGIIVQRDCPGYYYLTPAPIDQSSSFRGDLKRDFSERTKLSVGFLLEKDDRVYLERVLPSDACSIILKNHIHYFRHFTPESAEKTFSLISGLCRRVPFYRLHFKNDPSFWSVIGQEMEGVASG